MLSIKIAEYNSHRFGKSAELNAGLYDTRQAIRPEMGQDAIHKLQERYADKYSHMTMVEGKREDSLVLDKYAEGQEIQQMKREQQRRLQREHKQTQPKKKKNRDWER